jgi:anti-sigma factor RsiW
MSDIAALTASLALPVTRGLLPLAHAEGWITVAVARQRPKVADIPAAVNVWLHVLAERVRQMEERQDLVALHIKRRLKPMVAARQPWNQLMAAAHDLNGQADFPLGEAEVSELVRTEVWFALPPAPRRITHGR